MSSQEATDDAKPPPELSYEHLAPPNPNREDGTTTSIVFLHGLMSCTKEYSRVTPYLIDDYNLYLVDLPGHSGSRHIPFTLDNAINGLVHLITTKIPGGQAHVVGMSLGGYVSLELARRHPELFLSLFCTGCPPETGYRKWFLSRPRLLGGFEMVVGRIVPDSLFWAAIGVPPLEGVREEMAKNHVMETMKSGYGAVVMVDEARIAEIRSVRVAIVAGAKRDRVEATRNAGKVLAKANAVCKAFVVRDATHLWDLQLPELFAQGVKAWVEGQDMPKDFEVLS